MYTYIYLCIYIYIVISWVYLQCTKYFLYIARDLTKLNYSFPFHFNIDANSHNVYWNISKTFPMRVFFRCKSNSIYYYVFNQQYFVRIKTLYPEKYFLNLVKSNRPFPTKDMQTPPPLPPFFSHFYDRCTQCLIVWKINFPIFIFRVKVTIYGWHTGIFKCVSKIEK